MPRSAAASTRSGLVLWGHVPVQANRLSEVPSHVQSRFRRLKPSGLETGGGEQRLPVGGWMLARAGREDTRRARLESDEPAARIEHHA